MNKISCIYSSVQTKYYVFTLITEIWLAAFSCLNKTAATGYSHFFKDGACHREGGRLGYCRGSFRTTHFHHLTVNAMDDPVWLNTELQQQMILGSFYRFPSLILGRLVPMTEAFNFLGETPSFFRLIAGDFNTSEISLSPNSAQHHLSPLMNAMHLGSWAQHATSYARRNSTMDFIFLLKLANVATTDRNNTLGCEHLMMCCHLSANCIFQKQISIERPFYNLCQNPLPTSARTKPGTASSLQIVLS